MRYLVFDTETGGIGLDKSLLTAYFLVCNEDFRHLADLHLFMKPDDGVYRVTAESLSINNINLKDHERVAVSYKDAKSLLYQFLSEQYKKNTFFDHPQRLVAVGSGVKGDIAQITDKLISQGTWATFVDHVPLDIAILGKFYKLEDLTLEGMAKFFKIPVGQTHTAMADTILTAKILEKMEILRKYDK